MGLVGELRDAEGITRIDIADLEEDLRQGRLSGAYLLRYPPWTGEEFKRLQDIRELREALDSPNACFAQNLRNPRFPWASTVLTAAVLLTGLLNLWLIFRGWKVNAMEARLLAVYQGGLTGFEATLLNGNWWSPWSAQFVHAGPGHLLPNLAVIAYAGYRVERALGASAFWLVSAASVACGGLLVALFSAFAVMGSSILGYGFFGALLAIGFRFGETIPSRHRRFYGYGNLLLFAMLFVSGLRMEQASHLGHIGGLLGGIGATALLQPAIAYRQPERNRRRRWNLSAALLLSMAPLLWSPAVGSMVPGLAFGGSQRVVLEEEGVRLELPARLARIEGRLRGLPAFALSLQSEEGVFCGLEVLPVGESLDGDRLSAFWSQGDAVPIATAEKPPSLGEGWEGYAFDLESESGTFRVVEHQLRRGRWLLRAGYRIQSSDSGPSAFREAFYASFLPTIELDDPPKLQKARQAWLLKKDTRNALDYAEQLQRIGDWDALNELLEKASEREAPRQRKALGRWKRIRRQRIAFWRAHPEFNAPNAVDFVKEILRESPLDRAAQKEGILWLAANGDCEGAAIAYDRFKELREHAAQASGIANDLNTLCPSPPEER
ncbi:MAG: rhomboid family intramembrane serine protease [Myxococcota bacterium]|nr:rhomboid family intramembrane serine protease [Myxococcota bacterium]